MSLGYYANTEGDKMTEEKNEVVIDFEGENQLESNFERVLIPEDSYNAKISSVETIELPNYSDKNKKDIKLKITGLIQTEEGAKELVHFLTPKIMKANNKSKKVYSNSKLYDLLVDLKLKDKAQEQQEEIKTLDGLKLFLSQELVKKMVRVQVKTSKANTDEAYSTISKILRFVE